jgi:D-alanyl-D-alanine carboxypeptidase/D-alanyl-D-alanine-endopeptidase (penicillin-binding protein 4)
MKGQSAALRNRIRVKSGSMNGVRCYSGYILPSGYTFGPDITYETLPDEIRSKTIVFSIMTNNCTSPTWKVRPLLDKIMITLAGAN